MPMNAFGLLNGSQEKWSNEISPGYLCMTSLAADRRNVKDTRIFNPRGDTKVPHPLHNVISIDVSVRFTNDWYTVIVDSELYGHLTLVPQVLRDHHALLQSHHISARHCRIVWNTVGFWVEIFKGYPRTAAVLYNVLLILCV